MEYLGNKRNLSEFIQNIIDETAVDVPKEIVDLFCGTSTMSISFKRNNYKVIANDFLYFCYLSAKAKLNINREPLFEKIIKLIPNDSSYTPYENVIRYLNSLEEVQGFIYKNYSPASIENCEYERMYFTKENAAKIDAIRMKIKEWGNFITSEEEALLITDLLEATSNVSNVAGTYGCYMKHWKKRALCEIRLEKSTIYDNNEKEHIIFNKDANELSTEISYPIVYLDPPYTKRQYSAYYHILETIALYDNPDISGKTGLRDWSKKNSNYCYKKKASKALKDLIEKLDCKYIFLSYNSDGQINHENIIDILESKGTVTFHEIDYKRYKSNNHNNEKEPLKERLYCLRVEKVI